MSVLMVRRKGIVIPTKEDPPQGPRLKVTRSDGKIVYKRLFVGEKSGCVTVKYKGNTYHYDDPEEVCSKADGTDQNDLTEIILPKGTYEITFQAGKGGRGSPGENKTYEGADGEKRTVLVILDERKPIYLYRGGDGKPSTLIPAGEPTPGGAQGFPTFILLQKGGDPQADLASLKKEGLSGKTIINDGNIVGWFTEGGSGASSLNMKWNWKHGAGGGGGAGGFGVAEPHELEGTFDERMDGSASGEKSYKYPMGGHDFIGGRGGEGHEENGGKKISGGPGGGRDSAPFLSGSSSITSGTQGGQGITSCRIFGIFACSSGGSPWCSVHPTEGLTNGVRGTTGQSDTSFIRIKKIA